MWAPRPPPKAHSHRPNPRSRRHKSAGVSLLSPTLLPPCSTSKVPLVPFIADDVSMLRIESGYQDPRVLRLCRIVIQVAAAGFVLELVYNVVLIFLILHFQVPSRCRCSVPMRQCVHACASVRARVRASVPRASVRACLRACVRACVRACGGACTGVPARRVVLHHSTTHRASPFPPSHAAGRRRRHPSCRMRTLAAHDDSDTDRLKLYHQYGRGRDPHVRGCCVWTRGGAGEDGEGRRRTEAKIATCVCLPEAVLHAVTPKPDCSDDPRVVAARDNTASPLPPWLPPITGIAGFTG